MSTDAVNTPSGPKTLTVCKDGTTKNEDWIKIYEESFPPDQRQDLDDLRSQLKAGSFSEIESTKVTGLPPEVMEIRVKRKRFFLKLGLQPLDVDYIFPSYSAGDKPIHGELLWVPFSETQLSKPTLRAVVQRIYVEGYGLEPGDALISKVLCQF